MGSSGSKSSGSSAATMQVFLISVLVGLASAQGPRQTCQEGPGEKVGFVYIGSKKTEQPCCAKQKDVVCEPDAWYFPTTTATTKAECADAGVSRSSGVEGKANIQKGSSGDRVSICAWFKACEFYNPKKECVKSQLGGSLFKMPTNDFAPDTVCQVISEGYTIK